MNFYKHHIGDYAQATAHLSFVEDAAYSRLIRKYYAEEKPLPSDLTVVQRLIGARTEEEKHAVEVVLSEFFTLSPDGWRSKRCDDEIQKANAQAETNRQIAEAREAKKRARIVDGSLNEPSTNRSPVPSGEREPSQTPDSRQKEKKPISSAEEIFWSEGPEYLVSTGTPAGQARTFLGRCVKSHGLAESMRALEAAMQVKTGDPRAYITAVLEPRNRNAGTQLRVVV